MPGTLHSFFTKRGSPAPAPAKPNAFTMLMGPKPSAKQAAAQPDTSLRDTHLALPASSNAPPGCASSDTAPLPVASRAATLSDQVPDMFLTPAQRAAKAQAELDARKAADREARRRNSQLVSKPGKLNPFFTRVASSASDSNGGRVMEGAQQAAWQSDPARLTANVTAWNLADFPGLLGTPSEPPVSCAPPRPLALEVEAPSLPASSLYHLDPGAAGAAAACGTPRSTTPAKAARSCISTFAMGPLQGMPQHLLLPVLGQAPTAQCIEAAAARIAAEYAQAVAEECGAVGAGPASPGEPLLVSARAVHTSQRAPPLPVAARMPAKNIAGLVHALLQHVANAAQAAVPCGAHEVAQWWWRQWYQQAAPIDPGSVVTCRSTALYMAEWLGAWQPSGLPLDPGDASNESWCSAVDPTFARAMLLLGQPGSGRSAAVAAAAAATGYSVLRIGPDWYPNRSKRVVLQAVGEAASSARLHTGPATSPEQPSAARTVLLLDDVDVLYAQDRGFSDAVLSLATQGLCPIIATAAQCPEWLMGTPLWVRLPLLPPALCDVWVVARAIAWAARCDMSAQQVASVVAARQGQLAAAVQDIQAANSLSVLCGVQGVPSENGAVAQALAAQLVEASAVSDPGVDCASEPENLVTSSDSDSDIAWMPGFSPGHKRPRRAASAAVPAEPSTPPALTQQAVALAALVDSAVVRRIPALPSLPRLELAQRQPPRSILPATAAALLCGSTLEPSLPEYLGPTVHLVHPAECARPARPMSDQDVWTVVVEGQGFMAPSQPVLWLQLECLADDSQRITCPAVVRTDTQAVARIPTAAFPADATQPAYWCLAHVDQAAAQPASIASQARAPGCIVHVVAVRNSAVPASDVSDDGDVFEDEVARGELQAPSCATGPATPVQHWGCAVSAEELAALQQAVSLGTPAPTAGMPGLLSRCSTPMDAICAAADARALSDCLGTVRAQDACCIRGPWRGPAPCVQPVPRTADVYDNLLSDWSAASTVIEHVVDQSQDTLPSGPAAVERAVSQVLSAYSNRARVAHAASAAPDASAPALFEDEASDSDSGVVLLGRGAGQADSAEQDECALLHMVQRAGSAPCPPALLLLHAHLATLLGMAWLACAAVPGAHSCLERTYAARAGGWYESMKAPVPAVGAAKTLQLGRDRSAASAEPESCSAVPTLDGSSAGRLSMSMAAGQAHVCEQVRAQLDALYQGALRQAYECEAVPFGLPDGECAWARSCEAMACVHALLAGAWASSSRGLPGLAHATLAPGTGTGAARGSSAAREALFGTGIVGQMAYFGAVRSVTSHRRSKRWQHPLLTAVPGLSAASIALVAIIGAPSLASADPDVFGLA